MHAVAASVLPPPCPLCDASAETALATGRTVACTCGAEYLPPRSGASLQPASRPERPATAAPAERPPERLPRNAAPPSAARDLEALARVLPTLTGSASPLVRMPGGQSEGSPAERVQGLLAAALRGQRRLAGMRRAGHGREALALVATYVYAGPERRGAEAAGRAAAWAELVELALRDPEDRRRALAATPRPGAGPHAKAARSEGAALLARAEGLYAEAEEQATDGRWLGEDLETVSALLAALREDQRRVAAQRVRRSKSAETGTASTRVAAVRCGSVARPTRAPLRAPSVCRTGRGARFVEGLPLCRRGRGRCGR